MVQIDEIYRAIDGVRTRDVASRLALRGTGVAVKAAGAVSGDEQIGFYDIANTPEVGGRFGGALITSNKFENDPELFVGPFAQLGTFLGIENPVARFIVDAVFDPLNLVLPASGFLLNRVGKIANVATEAILAAEAAGKSVKTIDNVLDGLETGIKLATQSPEYLSKLRTAATSKISKKQWRSLIQEGLDAETTEAGKQILGAMQKNRGAVKDIYKLAKEQGKSLVGDGLVLQPTLRGRLVAGQVNPLIRIERPFARTREALTAQGVIGENSFFAVKRGDLFIWTPVSDKFVLGGGRVAETLLAKSGFQKGVQSLSDRVSPSVAIESVQDAGLFRVEADIERMLGNTKMVGAQLNVMLGNPSPRLHDDLVRSIEALQEPQLREMATSLGLKGDDLDIAKLHEFVLRKLDDAKGFDDVSVLSASNARQAELVDASRKGDLPFSPNEKLNAELNGTFRNGLRDLLYSRSLKAMQEDPGGIGNSLHSATGTVNVLGSSFMTQISEVITAGVRKTSPRIQGARKLETAYRESLRYFREHPELWSKDGDDVYKLSANALAKARKDAPGSIAMFERMLVRATENGIDMEAVLSRQGFMNGMSEVLDALTDLDNAMLTESARLGLHEEFVKNHFRRLVRISKRPRKGVGGSSIKATVGKLSGESTDDLIQAAIDDAIRLDPSLGKVKGVEGVQKLRRATESQLVAAEKLGRLEIEWDSLAAMSDQISGHQRAALARQFTDDLAMNARTVGMDQLEIMNKHSDFKSVPGWLKGVQKHMDLGQVTGKIPNVVKAEEVVINGVKQSAEPWEFMATLGFKENSRRVFDDFYEAVEVRGGIDVGDDFQRARRLVQRGAAADDAFLRGEAKKALRGALGRDEGLRRKLLKVTKSKGKAFNEDALQSIVEGRVPKGVREPGAIRKRITKELDERVAKARDKLLEDSKATKRNPTKVYVLRPMAGHLKDALGLWDKEGLLSDKGISGFGRFWRDWNHRLKAAKLNMSPFHLNVISAASILIDPAATAKLVSQPILKEYRASMLAFQAGGSVAGAAVGAGLGDDEESALFGGVVGLIYGTAIGAAMKQAKIARNFLTDPEMAPYALRAGHAGWNGRPNDRSIGVMAQMATRFSDKLKRDHGQTIATRMLDGFVGVQMDFEKVMWDWSHNGNKMAAFTALAQQNDARILKEGLEFGSPAFIAKQREYDRASMQVANSALGGFQASKLWNDPQWQRRAQDFLMSPDWTVGNILGAGNIFINQSAAKSAAQGALIGTTAELASVGFDPSELSGFGAIGGAGAAVALGALATRSMARIMVGEAGGNVARAQSLKLYRNAILGGYAFGNLVNYMNTGHFMWDNPEGKELAIAQPGGTYYVTLGKPYTETLEFASAIERDKVPVPLLSRLATKVSPLGQIAVQLATQRDGLGRPLMTVEQSPREAGVSLGGWVLDTVTPISLGRPIQAALSIAGGSTKPAGQQIAGSLLSSGGFAVSQDRGNGLEPFRAGALSATRPSPSGLGQLAAPSLAELVNPVNQRNLR